MEASIHERTDGKATHGIAEKSDYLEGPLAKAIEHQTVKLPSDLFLWGAVASMGLSLSLKLLKRKDDSAFVGQWAAPLLLLGVYNKLVKVSDAGAFSSPTVS